MTIGYAKNHVNQAVDLVAVEPDITTRAWRNCIRYPRAGQKRGQPSSNVDQAMQYIYAYLEDNASLLLKN